MTKPLVYCDYNAGAPVRAEAAVAMSRALAAGGNASSVHGAGRRMRALIEDAREKLAAAVEASVENVVFTSGATEALHLALAAADGASATLIVCATEHDAVFEHATRALGATRVAPVDARGVINPAGLESLLRDADKPALVCLHLANNETGVIQPIAKIATLCRDHGAFLLVDAAQALGRMPVSISALDATYLVVSSHKVGGPPGTGALILAPGAPFRTTRFGGGQERGRRPGTENGPAVVGFGTAVEWAARDMAAETERMRYLRDRFEAGLPREAVIFGADAPRLPNVSNFALPGLAAETAVIAMDLEGVAVSSGAACSSGKVRASRVLDAMHVPVALAKSALRVSFGYGSGPNDADIALEALNKVGARRKLAGAA
ncbi:cysteine desulfurase family protein [Terricaulis sp.]|uniref:cysteine desulfurase family protein n=1 Tax=Terricaulis sp. TaxID=2768686 RepID=UPI003783E825